jgi:hypothetical protein
MRWATAFLFGLLAAPHASFAVGDRALAMSLGGFSGSDTGGVAIGIYSLRPKRIGWYINGTVSSSADVDKDDGDFRPIPSDVRVDSETESTTINFGLTLALGPVAPYAGIGVTQISEYGLYRAPSAAFWYEEKKDTEGNVNVGILFSLHPNLGLDLGANSANEEIVLGLKWEFR